MKADRLPLLILALAGIASLVYAVYGFARAGVFVLTFLAERVSKAAASSSFGNFGLSILFLITPLSSLLLYCLLPVSTYGLAHGRTWVRRVVQAQLPLRLLDTSPTVPVAETALVERLAAPLPELWQTDAVFALLALAETGKAIWVFYLVRRQERFFQTASSRWGRLKPQAGFPNSAKPFKTQRLSDSGSPPVENMNFIRTVGAKTLDFIQSLGSITLFLLRILTKSATALTRPRLSIHQVYFFGVMSVLIIAVSGLFVGMMLGLQGYTQLAKFKSADILDYVVAASLLRELGLVLAVILFASSASDAMTSEIGLMKTTEQLEAMNVAAVDPAARVATPRFWVGMFSMPLLASAFNVTGIYGAYLVGMQWLRLDDGIFRAQVQNNISFGYDAANGLIRSAAFGTAVMLIAVHQGFYCMPTSGGILRASTRTVVSSALTVLAVDPVLTAWMFTE